MDVLVFMMKIFKFVRPLNIQVYYSISVKGCLFKYSSLPYIVTMKYKFKIIIYSLIVINFYHTFSVFRGIKRIYEGYPFISIRRIL